MSKGKCKIISLITPIATPRTNSGPINTNIILAGENAQIDKKIFSALSATDIQDLLTGPKFLEFDVEVMDCSQVTYNKTKYPTPVMREAFENELVLRKLNNGGLPCEANHPYQKEKDLKRWEFVDMNNITHFIMKTWFNGEKLMARIRTSLDNRKIVKNMLAGIMPAFSIRGLMQIHMEGDVQVADRFYFISLDYVDVQSNLGSTAIHSFDSLKVMSVNDMNNTDVDALPKASGEAAEFFHIDKDMVMVSSESGEFAGFAKVEYQDIRSTTDLLEEIKYDLFS